MTLIDAILFQFWAWFPTTAPLNARVYVRGERSFADMGELRYTFMRAYRKTMWAQMTPREKRFVAWLGWRTP